MNPGVPTASAPADNDVVALHAALLAEQVARRVAEQRASGAEAIIAHLKLVIAQMWHDRFDVSPELGVTSVNMVEIRVG